MDKVRRDYKCNRASGLSAGLQYQRPTGSEDYTDTVGPLVLDFQPTIRRSASDADNAV